MVSISSKSNIIERTKEYWHKFNIWECYTSDDCLNKILKFLQKEYELIPEKERIGKGSVYISKNAAVGAFSIIKDKVNVLDFVEKCFNYKKIEKENHLKNFAIALLSEAISSDKKLLIKSLVLIKEWADHNQWEIREMAGLPLRIGLKRDPSVIFSTFRNWARSDNPNLRRIVAESMRPLSDIKWLRNPEKNDGVLQILSILNADSSEYVRKSVGNNLKDLSKYMPEKILNILKSWIIQSEIVVSDIISSKSKKELGENKFYLIWTIKHGLRRLRERNPEFHKDIVEILGKNYLLYYDEKRNKMALKK